MNIETLRKLRQIGDEIDDLIFDLIFSGKITQSMIAYYTGQSECQVSLIFNPNHQAAFHIRHLPVLMKLLDGKEIAKKVCSFINMVPAEIPTTKPNDNHVMGSAGQLLSTVSDAIRDGELTCQEIHKIRGALCELIGAIDTLTATGVK